MNDKGKELVAKKIISTIKYMLHKKIEEPISMTWKEDKVKKSQEKHNNQIYEERIGPELNQEAVNPVLSRRLQKPPTTRKDDFLWTDIIKTKP
jgi:hypothetical protein